MIYCIWKDTKSKIHKPEKWVAYHNAIIPVIMVMYLIDDTGKKLFKIDLLAIFSSEW